MLTFFYPCLLLPLLFAFLLKTHFSARFISEKSLEGKINFRQFNQLKEQFSNDKTALKTNRKVVLMEGSYP
jgi:hypothetical protein